MGDNDFYQKRKASALAAQMPSAIGVDPHGFPIDLQRPKLQLPDGQYQTEYSMTVQLPDGRWYNVPTIWGGKAYDPEKQYQEILNLVAKERDRGWMFPNFDTVQEAEAAAPIRSKAIGEWRK